MPPLYLWSKLPIPLNTGADVATKRVRRASSVDDSANVIIAAGESSKTDPRAFIEQQRQMLNELKSSKLSAHIDQDVIMHDNDERTDSASELRIDEEHYGITPPNSALGDKLPITTQPGYSDADISRMYSEFVNIETSDYEKLIHPHESSRHGMLN